MQAVYYRDSYGGVPVQEFIREAPPNVRASILMQTQRLNQLAPADPPVPFPHSSQIAGELRELRCHFGRRLFRIIYRRSHNLFILLHIFEKASQEVPKREIEIALARWEDFTQRMDASPRRPPRAAGPDAP